jgi:signal transduction histidine kinase/ActR/RegA family two-component response regulator
MPVEREAPAAAAPIPEDASLRATPEPQPFPRWSFLSVVAITLVTVGFLARSVGTSYRVVQGFEETQLAIESVCGRITWLDEVLTMSARMAAATGDPRWQERYDECVARLDQAIAEAHRLAPGDQEDAAARQTDQANQALVAMELAAFERVRRGDRDGAALLLESPAYAGHKQVYARGMERFLASMRARTSELLGNESARADRAVALLAVALPLLATLWLLVGRSIRAHQRQQGVYQRALREHAEAVERGRREVETAMRAKSDFLARMSHEIRTPMNGVLGAAELLALTELDADQRELAATIQGSGSMLLSIIDDILDLSKLEAGMLRIAPVPTDVRRVALDVVALLLPRARGRGIELAGRSAAGLPACVSLDPTRLRQILVNLVGNAIKFTESGSVTLSADASVDAAGGALLRFEVADTGVGIAPERLESIFESFVQADDSIGRRFGGTGLGLSISRQLARLMGGRIEVASQVGVGTRFTLTVPAPVLAAPAANAAPAAGHAAARWDARVLIVEDNPVNLLVARRLIERTGCRVSSAANGEECLEKLALEPCDLIFMDCRMPVMDGFEATRRIRATEPPGRRLPIVALTASAFPGDVEACRAAGMDDFVAKPFVFEQLTGALLRWLGPPQPAPALPAERGGEASQGRREPSASPAIASKPASESQAPTTSDRGR